MLQLYGINIFLIGPPPPPLRKRIFCTLGLMLTIMDVPLRRHTMCELLYFCHAPNTHVMYFLVTVKDKNHIINVTHLT